MKRNILLLTAILFIAIAMMSHQNGPARMTGVNWTGSNGGPTGCEASGCHNGGTYINDSMPPAIYITDDNYLPVICFLPGNTYVITLKGTSTAPKWGFQISPSHTFGIGVYPAGWLTGDLPDAQDTFINDYSLVEHAHTLDVINDTMSVTTYWLAPIMPGVDTVNFHFAILNADGDGTVDGDNSNSYVQPFGHWTPETNSVKELFRNEVSAIVYPNPASDKLNIRLDDFSKGYHFIAVFDIQGKPVVWQKFDAGNSRELQLNTSNWPSGTYRVVVQKGNAQKVMSVVKL